jgi:GyrI-like small molecule binding domain
MHQPDVTVRLQRQASIAVAVVRRRVPQGELSRVVPECCGIVWNALRGQGIKGGRNIAIYRDGAIHLEAGVEVAAPFVEQDAVFGSRTPPGLVASVTHVGPYQTLGRAHDAIQTWCRTAGHRLAGPCWEIYGHWQREWESDPSRIQTEVCYLILEF